MDICEFKASLVKRSSSRAGSKAIQRILFRKTKRKTKQKNISFVCLNTGTHHNIYIWKSVREQFTRIHSFPSIMWMGPQVVRLGSKLSLLTKNLFSSLLRFLFKLFTTNKTAVPFWWGRDSRRRLTP